MIYIGIDIGKESFVATFLILDPYLPQYRKRDQEFYQLSFRIRTSLCHGIHLELRFSSPLLA